jgi:hypothetical protein
MTTARNLYLSLGMTAMCYRDASADWFPATLVDSSNGASGSDGSWCRSSAGTASRERRWHSVRRATENGNATPARSATSGRVRGNKM